MKEKKKTSLWELGFDRGEGDRILWLRYGNGTVIREGMLEDHLFLARIRVKSESHYGQISPSSHDKSPCHCSLIQT